MASTNVTLEDKIEGKTPQVGYSNLKVAKAVWIFGTDGGAVSTITPKNTTSLPKNAVIVAGTINSTTALTTSASGTLSVGTSAGSSTTAILAATAVASLGLNALVNAVPVFATPVKLSAAGNITVTIATGALTAGAVEITLFYFVSQN